MTGLGIALVLSSIWGLCLGAVGLYWAQKERKAAEKLKGQYKIPFQETNDVPTLVGGHSSHR
jgi:hypothetical protein